MVTFSTFDIAAYNNKKTEDLIYFTKYRLYISTKKVYIQSKKCFYIMAILPNIYYNFQADAISNEPWINKNIKKYYKKYEDWHCIYIVVNNKVVNIL